MGPELAVQSTEQEARTELHTTFYIKTQLVITSCWGRFLAKILYIHLAVKK